MNFIALFLVFLGIIGLLYTILTELRTTRKQSTGTMSNGPLSRFVTNQQVDAQTRVSGMARCQTKIGRCEKASQKYTCPKPVAA